MKYHQPSKAFIITPDTVQFVADSLMYSLKAVRQQGGKPLEPYEVGMMDMCDHAQAAIMDVANSLDIDLGHERFNKIDLSNVK